MFKHFDDHICFAILPFQVYQLGHWTFEVYHDQFKVQIDEFKLKIYELKCELIQLRLAHDIWKFVLKRLGFVMVLGGS
jgi:hypothetical protein